MNSKSSLPPWYAMASSYSMSVLIYLQGCSHAWALKWYGCSRGQWERHRAREAQKRIFTFIFELSGWALVTPSCFLKTRKRCFQTVWSHWSLALSTWLQTGLLGTPRTLAEMRLLPRKVVGLKPDQPDWWLWPCIWLPTWTHRHSRAPHLILQSCYSREHCSQCSLQLPLWQVICLVQWK